MAHASGAAILDLALLTWLQISRSGSALCSRHLNANKRNRREKIEAPKYL
jgi:hypothetical protein